MNIVLPSEIINIIFEFNPEHRPLLGECLKRVENYKLLKELPLKGSLSRYRYLLNKFDDKVLHSGEKMDMEALVRKHINDPNVFIKNYNKCKCCKRHQRERPRSLYDKSFVSEPNPSREPSYMATCNCPCRHNSRFIYKTFNNLIDIRTPFSTEWAEYMHDI